MIMRVLLAARRSITDGARVAVRDYRSIESQPPPPPLAQESGGGRGAIWVEFLVRVNLDSRADLFSGFAIFIPCSLFRPSRSTRHSSGIMSRVFIVQVQSPGEEYDLIVATCYG